MWLRSRILAGLAFVLVSCGDTSQMQADLHAARQELATARTDVTWWRWCAMLSGLVSLLIGIAIGRGHDSEQDEDFDRRPDT